MKKKKRKLNNLKVTFLIKPEELEKKTLMEAVKYHNNKKKKNMEK